MSGTDLFVNPDLWLFLELEEKKPCSGIWWDPRRGVEALRRRTADGDELEIVEIRVAYLLKYLQARQLSLVIGHYRHLHLFDPSPNAITAFVEGNVIAALMENFKPDIASIPVLLKQAEGKSTADEPDLQVELERLYRLIRGEFAPLAFLYDLRTHSGLAHHPNLAEARVAAVRLHLPDKNWYRADYIRLLTLITDGIRQISGHLWSAAWAK